MRVPDGQSVALTSRPAGIAIDLLDAVAGLRRPRTGQVFAGSTEVQRLTGHALERYRAHRGLLSARYPLLPSLSVLDNVLGAQLSGRVGAETLGRADKLLAVAGVAHLAGRPAGALAADQQWRVMVARALLPAPQLVLAEDPAPGLEPAAASAVLDLLFDAHEQARFTLLLCTPSLAAAARCDRVVTLTGAGVGSDDLTGGDDPRTRGRVDRIG